MRHIQINNVSEPDDADSDNWEISSMTDDKSIVYIVDDDPSIGKALGRLLKSWGCHYRLYTSAEIFLKDVDLTQVECLVLDIMLPGMDGLELQQELMTRGYKIPIVFITGHGDKELRDKVMDEGAYGYLDKPFDEGLLIGMIKTIFEKKDSSSVSSIHN